MINISWHLATVYHDTQDIFLVHHNEHKDLHYDSCIQYKLSEICKKINLFNKKIKVKI